jgi:hypothetical protein
MLLDADSAQLGCGSMWNAYSGPSGGLLGVRSCRNTPRITSNDRNLWIGSVRAYPPGWSIRRSPSRPALARRLSTMTFKLIESAQARWRAVNAPHLVALVRAGARFERGVLVEREQAGAA